MNLGWQQTWALSYKQGLSNSRSASDGFTEQMPLPVTQRSAAIRHGYLIKRSVPYPYLPVVRRRSRPNEQLPIRQEKPRKVSRMKTIANVRLNVNYIPFDDEHHYHPSAKCESASVAIRDDCKPLPFDEGFVQIEILCSVQMIVFDRE